MESEVTRSIGNGVPAQNDRNRAMIKSKAARNIVLPINDFNLNLIMYHPIQVSHPNCNHVYIFGYIRFLLKI